MKLHVTILTSPSCYFHRFTFVLELFCLKAILSYVQLIPHVAISMHSISIFVTLGVQQWFGKRNLDFQVCYIEITQEIMNFTYFYSLKRSLGLVTLKALTLSFYDRHNCYSTLLYDASLIGNIVMQIQHPLFVKLCAKKDLKLRSTFFFFCFRYLHLKWHKHFIWFLKKSKRGLGSCAV